MQEQAAIVDPPWFQGNSLLEDDRVASVDSEKEKAAIEAVEKAETAVLATIDDVKKRKQSEID